MTDFFSGAQDRFDEAVARRDAIRDAWLADGGRFLSEGSMGQVVEHPLVKMLREHDVLVDRLGKVVEKRAARGPVPSAQMAESIGRSPAVAKRRLKAVKSA